MKHSEAHAINFNYFACPMFETASFPDWVPILNSACYNLAACIAPVRRASAIQTLQIFEGNANGIPVCQGINHICSIYGVHRLWLI